ncbi:ribosomal protection-like ABC-F family protein [Paenibacillus massiliensis]|uniref:ribosomal protection-like ABC-F family protein n=1 Tax=Paenibacillus massiliensis TaxID=225917 RepID=UPI00040D5549|nr:ABC-F family ATP-binding cassette domain-containing protein [Paenibacillus massiliensis]
MHIVSGQQLIAYHGANLILNGVTFEIHEGEKVGLIGRNGSGKTTLLRLIARLGKPDAGQLILKKDSRVGYLPQIPVEYDALTVYETLAYEYRQLMECKANMTLLEQDMSNPVIAEDAERLEQLLKSYASMQEQFEHGGGYEMDAHIQSVADGLRIPVAMYDRPFSSLSGGEKTRIVLASQLIGRPDLLLLDEPTNHLDLKGIEWLEQFLRSYTGAVLVVSHDRYFLDRVAGKMLELEDGEAHTYLSNYSGYVREKEERLLIQFADYQEQQKQIKKMKEAIKRFEEWGRIGDNEKFFKKAASIRKALERMDRIKRPVLERQSAEFELNPQERSGRRVLQFEGIVKAYGGRQILQGVEGGLEFGEKIALLGDNGSGKSTLLRILLGEESPDLGDVTWGARVEYGYLAQQETRGEATGTVLSYFRQEVGVEEGEARHILAAYMFYGADVFRSVSTLSGGEWSRLRLALLVMQKPNLLLLDEPTNHLDIDSREALEEALESYGGTVLAISHDRYFVNKLAGRVWELEQGQITSYLGNFDDFRAKKQELQRLEATSSDAAALMSRSGAGLPSAGASLSKASSSKASSSASSVATAGASSSKARSNATGKREKKADSAKAVVSREQLEQRIADLEQALHTADTELEVLASGAETGGPSGASAEGKSLQQLWEERERLQQELDQVLEAWVEL